MRTKPSYNMRTKPQQKEDNASNTGGGTKPHIEKNGPEVSTKSKGKQENTTIRNATG